MPTDAAQFDCPSCARCGSDCYWIECEHCGGEGVDGHDCGDDTCACLYPEDNRTCDVCRGEEGWWVCSASAAWCEAHPMIGREAMKRT